MSMMMMPGVAPRYPRPIPPVDTKPLVGCYVGGANGTEALAAARAFDRFLGQTTGLSLCFAINNDKWATGVDGGGVLTGAFANPWIIFSEGGDYGRQNRIAKEKRIMCSIPLNCSGGTALRDVATGIVHPNNIPGVTTIDIDELVYWYGQAAVDCGADDCIWRLGWEVNDGGYYHGIRYSGSALVNYDYYMTTMGMSQADALAAIKLDYIAAYRRYVDVLRSVPGNNFQFAWCPLKLDNGCGVPTSYYPGDDVVDYIAPDIYNNFYNTDGINDLALRFDKYTMGKSTYTGSTTGNAAGSDYCLRYFMEMARAKQKQMIICEWGTGFRGTVRGDWSAGTYNSRDYVKYGGNWYYLDTNGTTSSATPGNSPWLLCGATLGALEGGRGVGGAGGDDGVYVASMAAAINDAAPLDNGKPLFYAHIYWNADNGKMAVDRSSYFTGSMPTDMRDEKPAATAAFLAGFGRT